MFNENGILNQEISAGRHSHPYFPVGMDSGLYYLRLTFRDAV